MTNEQVLRLYNVLSMLRQRVDQQIINRQQGVVDDAVAFTSRFIVVAAYNVGLLRPIADPLREVMTQPWVATIQEYDRERSDRMVDFIVLPPGATRPQPNYLYGFKEGRAEDWALVEKELQEKYKDALDAQAEATKLLSQEAPPLQLERVGIEDLPVAELASGDGEALTWMFRPTAVTSL